MSEFSEHRNGNRKSGGCIALIGVGANLSAPDGSPAVVTCRRAVAMLDRLPGLRVCGLSRWFLTAPVPPSGQPDYINGVAALRWEPGRSEPGEILDPAVLLGHLLTIETACGRVRSVANAARTLDLDLIAMGDLVRQAPDPIVPHPRAHLRAFVLAPLVDVAPDWMHPVLRRTASELLAALPPQAIRPMADRG
jgi:2-amino-4-hydroxy-6-hydroxymethyldihydropteridine diphosphokinase